MSWLANLSKNHVEFEKNFCESSYNIDGSSTTGGTSSSEDSESWVYEEELILPPSLEHYLEVPSDHIMDVPHRMIQNSSSSRFMSSSNQIAFSPSEIIVPVEPVDDVSSVSSTAELEVLELVQAVKSLMEINSEYVTKISELERVTKSLQSDLVKNEKDLGQLMQYNRRENIEIAGIPANIPDSKLEGVVVDIFRRLGLKYLSYYEIAGCHRLKNRRKSATNVIVRFLCRKRAHEVFDNAYNLKERFPEFPNLQFVENLCPKYKLIYDHCMELWQQNVIRNVWTFNGTIFVKKTDSSKPKTILHMSDLQHHSNLDS